MAAAIYSIKEIYFTIQGEGMQTGRPAVFLRFAGCNLWSGREEDRYKAICQFCDTDFFGVDGVNGGKYEVEPLVEKVGSLWPSSTKDNDRYVVCTGGEPLLQLDEMLIHELHKAGFVVGIETNGTISVPSGVDWICVSPKAGSDCIVKSGNELKLVYPQKGLDPSQFEDWDFEFYFLQPMAGPDLESNTKKTIEYCLNHPRWRLSLQMHKLAGLK